MKKLKEIIKKVLVFTSYTSLVLSFYFAFLAILEAIKVNEGMIFMYYSVSDFLLQTEPSYLFFKYGNVLTALLSCILSLFAFVFLKFLADFNADDRADNYVDLVALDISLKADAIMERELYPYPIKNARELSKTYKQITDRNYNFKTSFEVNMDFFMFSQDHKNEKKKEILSKLYAEYEHELQKYTQESWQKANKLFCLCSQVITRNSNLSKKKQLYLAKTMYYFIFKNTHIAFDVFGVNEPKNYDEVFLEYLKIK